jgi:hypothetical protein
MKQYKLFLDDLRMPDQAGSDEIYKDNDWIIVRSYDEFVKCIDDNGAPELVSFDHDLGLEHIRYYFENGGHDNPPDPDQAQFKEKTGKDCANYLTEYCTINGLPLPEYKVHSRNPVGKENIINFLESYKRHFS